MHASILASEAGHAVGSSPLTAAIVVPFLGAIAVALRASFKTGEAGFQYEVQRDWVADFGISWHLGIDGISLFLVVLAGLAIVGGGLNLPFTSDLHFLGHWLEPVLEGNERVIDVATGTKVGLALIATAAAFAGIALATLVYLQKRVKPVEPQILADGWHYDDAISAFVGGPGTAGFEATATFDKQVVDGAVNGVAGLFRRSGGALRHVQTGFVRSYALGVAVGVVALLAYFLSRATF